LLSQDLLVQPFETGAASGKMGSLQTFTANEDVTCSLMVALPHPVRDRKIHPKHLWLQLSRS